MCPITALPLERIVGEGEITIGNHRIPAGTKIGASIAAIHSDERVFGNDVDHFKPERWYEASKESLKQMEKAFMGVSPPLEVHNILVYHGLTHSHSVVQRKPFVLGETFCHSANENHHSTCVEEVRSRMGVRKTRMEVEAFLAYRAAWCQGTLP